MVGGEVGSSEVTFYPSKPKATQLRVDMKTAASITLALQAVVPAIALSGIRLTLSLVGGTDVPWSPPFDYFAAVAGRGFGILGIEFRAACSRRGYYPRGGGLVECTIEPSSGIRSLTLLERPQQTPVRVESRCAQLPRHVAERQASLAESTLKSRGVTSLETVVTEEAAESPGSSLVVSSVGEGYALGGDSIGSKGKRAEEVGSEGAEAFLQEFVTGSCLDSSIADMLAPLLALAPGKSTVRISRVTTHLTTSLHVAELFQSFSYSFRQEAQSTVLIVGAT